jgi:uncharacterized protein
MSQPFKLFRLQKLDSQLDKVYARIKEIEKTLSDNTILLRAQAKLDDATRKSADALKALQEAERNVQTQQVKIEQSESTLYGGKVRNPKELQDLQNEAAALKRYKGVLEDRQLEAMIKFDEAENKLFTARAALDQVVADLEQRNHKLNIEQETLSQEVVRLEAERGAASATIDKNSLDQYNNLRKSRKGVAVAKVTGKNCSACGSTLSAALQQAARSPNELNFCDTCGRILYSG